MNLFLMLGIMKPSHLLRKIHKWIGLIIGIQILLWFVSGLVMTWFDIDTVHGDHLLKEQKHAQLANLSQSLSEYPDKDETILYAQSISLMEKPYLLVKSTKNATQQQSLFDPRSKAIISPLPESMVKNIVQSQLAQDSNITSIQLLTELPGEVRGRPAPIWQVQLDDEDNSRIYVSPVSGQILAKRTDTWRLFDFMWMLHIMDYDERSDFNHPLLIISTLLALFVAISGIWLLFYTIKLRKKKTTQ
ncbi:PepSY domain-containing protein [Marinicella rhabdoformis]|uniref:PepSY domain-containing protein n=1 Tax=Marinicella rhabdoformis TaxID=2580566 RepID=UPI0015CFEB50|nr:PepSY domain-containing protein [Marinicella rhabdoformis]